MTVEERSRGRGRGLNKMMDDHDQGRAIGCVCVCVERRDPLKESVETIKELQGGGSRYIDMYYENFTMTSIIFYPYCKH